MKRCSICILILLGVLATLFIRSTKSESERIPGDTKDISATQNIQIQQDIKKASTLKVLSAKEVPPQNASEKIEEIMPVVSSDNVPFTFSEKEKRAEDPDPSLIKEAPESDIALFITTPDQPTSASLDFAPKVKISKGQAVAIARQAVARINVPSNAYISVTLDLEKKEYGVAFQKYKPGEAFDDEYAVIHICPVTGKIIGTEF